MSEQAQRITPDNEGKIDDIHITCDRFRMERMNDGLWWIAVYRGGKEVSFMLHSKKLITAVVQQDDFGCEP